MPRRKSPPDEENLPNVPMGTFFKYNSVGTNVYVKSLRTTQPKRVKRIRASAKGKGKKVRRSGLSLMASAEEPKPRSRREAIAYALAQMKGLYRPVKKPVTMRLDADVIAWFKKDGRRYQSRINEALRKVMEREMKEMGK